MNLTIETTEQAELRIVSEETGNRLLEQCSRTHQHAALRAIAEHLGPETVREVMGADEARDAVTIGDLYMEMPCPVCETQIAVRGSSDPDDPIDLEPASDGPLQGAIRAAGYDPDEVGAAEVIRSLTKARDDVTDGLQAAALDAEDVRKQVKKLEARKRELEAAYCGADRQLQSARNRERTAKEHRGLAEKDRDTARAQLREWETSTASSPGEVDHWRGLAKAACDALGLDFGSDHLSPSDVTDAVSELRSNPLSTRAQRAEAQLREWRETVGPVLKAWEHYGIKPELGSWIISAAPAIKRLLSATPDEGTYDGEMVKRLEAERECDRLRKRVGELEAELAMTERAVGGTMTDAHEAIESVGLTVDDHTLISALQSRHEDAIEQEEIARDGFRAETAVEATRALVQYFRQNRPMRPDTIMFELRFADADKALADYDAGTSAEPTDEQPQARAGGKRYDEALDCLQETAKEASAAENECDEALKRVEELEAELAMTERAVGGTMTDADCPHEADVDRLLAACGGSATVDDAMQWIDRKVKRVEKLEAELAAAKGSLAHCVAANNEGSNRLHAAVTKLQRAEIAVEAFRPWINRWGRDMVMGPGAREAGAAAVKALADYDAGKEPDERAEQNHPVDAGSVPDSGAGGSAGRVQSSGVPERRSEPAEAVRALQGSDDSTSVSGSSLDVPREVHESEWQWRPTGEYTAFAPPFGTVRQCVGCGALVGGGPTRCIRCARDYDAGTSAEPTPIDMVIHCPRCGMQHVDAPEPGTDWDNPPHKSHQCHGCGLVWRVADVPTNGVAATKTRGKADTWPTDEQPQARAGGTLEPLVQHAPGPPSGDTPETIARRALVMIPEPGSTELLTDEIAKRIRRYANMMASTSYADGRIAELHNLYCLSSGESGKEIRARIDRRIRALESGGKS